MRTILRKTTTKQIAGYVLLSLLTLLFIAGFMHTDRFGVAAALIATAWAVMGMIGFACMLQKGFTWAMGE